MGKARDTACNIELKQPIGFNPYENPLYDDAEGKAIKFPPQSPYFATWNVNKLILWKTNARNKRRNL